MPLPALPRPLAALCSWCAAVLLFVLPGAAHADRAVIIGVSHYQNSSFAPNLPGIDRDVENARTVIARFHVEPSPDQVRVLTDSKATAENIKAAMDWALQAGPAERVIIYFSGHGTHTMGGDGKLHSSLVAHDFQPLGNGLAKGAVPGDWIGSELRSTHAGYVLLLVDACESGTIYRNFSWDAARKEVWQGDDGRSPDSIVIKHVETPGAPPNAPVEEFSAIKGGGASRSVVLTAVQANQYAPASPVGSPFTVALTRTVTSRDPWKMTPARLRDEVAEQLSNDGVRVDTTPHGVNPQVWSSDTRLLQAPLAQLDSADAEPPGPATPPPAPAAAPGERWSLLQQVVADSEPGTVEVSGVKGQYKVGEQLTLTLTLKRGGYLTLINVDQQDHAELNVPSRMVPTQLHLDAGTYTLPAYLSKQSGHTISFRADSPGDILLVAIISPQPIATLKGTEGELDAATIKSLIPKATCPSGRCRSFVTHVEDADSSAPQVTRREAVSARMVIVP